MPFSVETRMENEIAVFQLTGALTLGPSLGDLRKAAHKMLGKSKLTGIVLDLASVSSVDSSGLGELTIVYSSMSRRNCPMRLIGVSPSLRKMLEMTHLDAVLVSAVDLAAAKRDLEAGKR